MLGLDKRQFRVLIIHRWYDMKNANIFLKTKGKSDIIGAVGSCKLDFDGKVLNEELNKSEKYKNCTDPMIKFRMESDLINKMNLVGYLYNCKPNWYMFVYPKFKKENIVEFTLKMFENDDFICNTAISPACFYVDTDELFVGVCTQLGVTSFIEFKKHTDNSFKFSFRNLEEFISFFDLPKNVFDGFCTECSFTYLVHEISEILGLPLDVSYNKMNRAPKHMGACRYRA